MTEYLPQQGDDRILKVGEQYSLKNVPASYACVPFFWCKSYFTYIVNQNGSKIAPLGDEKKKKRKNFSTCECFRFVFRTNRELIIYELTSFRGTFH